MGKNHFVTINETHLAFGNMTNALIFLGRWVSTKSHPWDKGRM